MILFLILFTDSNSSNTSNKRCWITDFHSNFKSVSILINYFHLVVLHTGLSFCIILITRVRDDSFLSVQLSGVEGSLGFLLTNQEGKTSKSIEVSDETRFYSGNCLKELSLATEVLVATLLTLTKEVSKWNPRINY